MKRLLLGFMWVGVFIFLLVALDQIFLHYRGFKQPLMQDMQKFHANFRQRLFGLPQLQPPPKTPTPQKRSAPDTADKKAASMDALVIQEIGREGLKNKSRSKTAPDNTDALRYIYIDAQQNIQFAQRLEEIPPPLRNSARLVIQ